MTKGQAIAGSILILFCLLGVLAGWGWIAGDWNQAVGRAFDPPAWGQWKLWLGTDLLGRSVVLKVIQGAKISLFVGASSAFFGIVFGVLLGSVAGYFGRWTDAAVMWLIQTLSAIPNILLLMAIAFVLGKGLGAVVLALGATSWIGLARVIRGEFLKRRECEYVLAAESVGAGHGARMFRHILPNVSHFVGNHAAQQFAAGIKAEVILSFLGLGVQSQPSWGIMMDDAKLELARGVWWQLAGATGAMFFVILAINLLTDRPMTGESVWKKS